MKSQSTARLVLSTALLGLVFFACFISAWAQTTPNITAFVCTEPVYVNGVQTEYLAHFGYYNRTSSVITVQRGQDNFVTPPSTANSQLLLPTQFQPGYHDRVFFFRIAPNVSPSWFLLGTQTLASNDPALRCGQMTYQGRLSDGAAQANGSYDLRFTFYEALTDGAAQGDTIVKENVPATNGIFTVQLEVGTTFINKTLNPRFLEIAVRPGAAAGNDPFTTLNPRQPISEVPFAVNAVNALNAANALNATNAAQLNGIPGNQYLTNSSDGTINGNLNVTGTITSSCRAGFTAFNNGRLCVSAMQTAGTFYGANGAMLTCSNLGARVGTTTDVTLTFSPHGFN